MRLAVWSVVIAEVAGRDVPELDFTSPMSDALTEPPLTLTSWRKFEALTVWPEAAFIWPMSVAFTLPAPFTSPARKPTLYD